MYPFPHYGDFTAFTPVVPELYWNVYSAEERIKALCMEWVKLTAFTDAMVDTVNEQYAELKDDIQARYDALDAAVKNIDDIVKDMQESLPQLVNDDVIAEIRRLIDSGEFDDILEAAIAEYWAQYEQRIISVETGLQTLNGELATERDARIAEDTQIRGELTTAVDRLDVQDERLQENIDNLSARVFPPSKNGVIAITAPRASWAQQNSHSLFYSDDGITFEHVSTIPALTQNSNALAKINGWFYHSNGNLYRFSKDLINWSEDYEIPIEKSLDMPDGVIWAGSLFNDYRRNKIYFMCAREYKAQDGTFNGTGHSQRYFDIVCVEVTQNDETGVLTLTEDTQRTLIHDGSHIDPYAIMLDSGTIIFACKNEHTCKIEIYTGNRIDELTITSATNPLVGVEAPQLITDGRENVILYVDGYSPRTIDRNVDANAVAQAGNWLPECSLKTTIINKGALVQNYLWEVVFYPDVMAHAAYMQVDDEILNIVNNYEIVHSTVPKFDKTRMTIAEFADAPVIRYYLTNIPPFWNYTFGGNPTSAHCIVLKTPVRIFKTYCKSWIIGCNSKYLLNNNYIFTNENKTTKLATNNCYEGGSVIMYDSDWAFQFPIITS